MQILRQALLQKLSTSIILFKVIRNKILCLTQFQLVLLSIDEGCKKVQIPYSGTNVWVIEMSKDYIAILQRSGNLEIRRLDNIKQVVFTQSKVKIINQKYPKLKWSEDDLHIVYQKRYDEISIPNKQFVSQTLPFEIKQSQTLLQLEFCDLFPGLKTVFYIMTNSIHMCLNGFELGLIKFQDQEIKQVLRLCHPLQGNDFNKQYLVVLTETLEENKDARKAFLKVYNILDMREIFSKEMYKPKDQLIQICSDQLCEYLLVKYYKGKASNINSIQSQNLMKINGDYYYSKDENYFDSNESFFNFDIMIGLGKNLKLFPSHSERINGKLCNSIDTCYYEKNQICIASIVLQASYKDQIFYNYKQLYVIDDPSNQQSSNNHSDLVIWKQLVEAQLSPKNLIDQIVKSISLKSSSKTQMETSFSVQIGIQQQKIIQNLLSRLNKFNQLNSHEINKAYSTIKKIIAIEYFPMLLDMASIERNYNKTTREILEKSNEDFMNTMSGFSSSQTHSPRSIKSDQSQRQEGLILREISKDLSRTGRVNRGQFCVDCIEIEDHENLQLIEMIEEESSMKAKSSLTKIQQQIERMETLCKYRLEKMEMKTRKDKKIQKKVVSLIQNEFKQSLKAIEVSLMKQAKEFTSRLSQRTQIMGEKQSKTSEFIQKMEDNRIRHENQLKIRKQNKEELLDYLYDIEFPQVGVQTYEPAQSLKTSFNQSMASNSGESPLNRRIGEFGMGKDGNEDFKFFSEFILKNYI